LVRHIHETQLRLDSAIFRAEQRIDNKMLELVDQTVVDEIKAFANAAGVPPEYLASVRVVKTGWMKCQVELDYTKNGKPLGLQFEFGTRAHKIFGHPVLKFFWERIGRWVTFGKVNHPGTKPFKIMTLSENRGLQRFAELASQDANKYMDEMKIP